MFNCLLQTFEAQISLDITVQDVREDNVHKHPVLGLQ